MNYLTDQSLLLLYCLGSLLFVPAGISFVIAFFLAVSACAFLYVRAESPAGLASACCFVSAALLVPELVFFAPMAACFFCYAVAHSRRAGKRRYRALLACCAAVFFLRLCALRDPRLIFYVSLGVAAALLLCFRACSYEISAGNYRRIYDSDHEKKLLLEAENRALIRQQNSEIYAATLKERTRIAREIHDNVGHLLTRSILMVGALRAVSRGGAAEESLAQLEDTLGEAMNSIRQSVHDLHDSSIDLERTLRSLTGHFPFCPVTLQYGAAQDVPSEVRYCMISVTKEALANISRHSNATRASVTVQEHPAFYQLMIRDNGTQKRRELSEERAPELSGGIGLSNMRSRVSALNGSMRILREDGFYIHITIPKQ